MAGTINYERPKATPTNTTGMVATILVAEQPDSPGAIGGTGTTGILDATFRCDADESGGADVQDWAKFTVQPKIDNGTGKVTFEVTFTPVKGDGSDGAVQRHTFTHDEFMDAWQTAAGRARQP